MSVQGRDAMAVGAIALLAGVGVLLAGPSPTATTAIDGCLVIGFVSLAVWASASAPWWMGVIVAGVAGAVAVTLTLVLVAVVGVLAGLTIGVLRRSVPWSRAAVAAVATQIFARLGNTWFFGASSLIGISLVSALALWGLVRRPGGQRRALWIMLAAAAGTGLVAVIGLAVAASSARPHLERGNAAAREGIAQLAAGEFAGAQTAFEDARAQFDKVSQELSQPWGQLARVVPVAAQYRRTGTVLADRATHVSAAITAALAQIDPEKLAVHNGRIDVDAIRAVEAPLRQLSAQLDAFEAAINDADSPWLLQPVRDRFTSLKALLARQRETGDTALYAVQHAPAMLGADGQRVYFIAFTTPAEARGLGGFMGNWAEITVTDGHIEMTNFGRTSDLEPVGSAPTKHVTGPADFLKRYGRYGFVEPDTGGARPTIWHDVTISPHFPSVAQVIAELYPQSGGKHLDGVFAMDVYTLAALLDATGPITLAGLDTPLTSANAPQYLLRDQYLLASRDERIDVLEQLAKETVSKLLAGGLPSPPKLAKLLSPLVAEQRLIGWAVRPEEEELFKRIRLNGALPALGGGDGLALTFNNAGNSKIDSYLDGSINYVATPNFAAGSLSADVTIQLHNGAPVGSVPDYVIGNSLGLPTGTSHLYLSVFTAVPFTAATLDGHQLGFDVTKEAGYLVSSAYIDLGPGQSSTITMHLEGEIDLSKGYSLAVRSPPAVRPLPITITVKGTTDLRIEMPDSGVARYYVAQV